MKTSLLIVALGAMMNLSAQNALWNPDLGNGKYKNPVIYADYSDPDVVAVGDDYYMTASSFGHIPGLPVLHSKDLVNWELIGHAIQEYPDAEIGKPQHGAAVWAPSIRFHEGEFYIYYGDPDRGLFMTKAKNPAGPWSELKLIKEAKGWIDCCPLWDDNGKAYIVHAYAKSRSGIKSKLAIVEMNWAGDKVIGKDSIIFDGTETHPTLEGPKFYKKDGKYIILAPAGGVKPGWQEAFRSDNVYGPYEYKTVMEQGSTKINGPHQGGWITTSQGEDWFVHFQDRYAYGRLAHLNPVNWVNGWPEMGVDIDGNGIGEPVSEYTKPKVGKVKTVITQPPTSDEFDKKLGLQWQWQSNFSADWFKVKSGSLVLAAQKLNPSMKNLWTNGSILLQKFPAPEFKADSYLKLNGMNIDDRSGLLVFSYNYNHLSVVKTCLGYELTQMQCIDANSGTKEEKKASQILSKSAKGIYLRVEIYPANPEEIIPEVFGQFSYSLDGKKFEYFGEKFLIKEAHWVGAKLGLFAVSESELPGEATYDYFRISKR